MAAVTVEVVQQQRHQLGRVHRAQGKRRVGSANGWGAEEWWSRRHPLITLALLGWSQSLVRRQQQGRL